MQGFPAALALAIGVALAVLYGQSWLWLAAAAGSTVLLLALPLKYTLTSTGIRMAWTAPRRWTEFASVRRATGGACLVGGHKLRDMRIWLSDSRGDDEFLHFLRQAITDAYKGNATVVPYPVNRPTPPRDPIGSDRMSAYSSEG